MHVRLREAKPGDGNAPAQAAFDFTLYGVDRDVLVNVRDYRVAWLVDTSAQFIRHHHRAAVSIMFVSPTCLPHLLAPSDYASADRYAQRWKSCAIHGTW